MEYVKGAPITEYCDETRLDIPQRLKLFAQVCQTVQHAHQKGIIHRDLKPSNILVAVSDDHPVPKVIDFGLAKALYQSLTERTLHTAHEMVLGTPLYMAPEQARINNLDIDTRADIYSLGVLLYELLTGTTPLEKRRLKDAAWQEVLRLIYEEEPPRPSIRLSSAEMLPSVAAVRQLEPVKLTKLVRGELDWIVMKALEKDRNRRYETASGFSLDIQRYLAGEPVQAAPPAVGYRLKKFARKHRAAILTTMGIALLLTVATGTSIWQAIRATTAETNERSARLSETKRATSERQARIEAQNSAEAEKQALAQAKRRLEQVERSVSLIFSILEDIDIREVKAGTEPLEAVIANRLIDVAREINAEVVDNQLVLAKMQARLGLTLHNLGYSAGAIPLLTKARESFVAELGNDDPGTQTIVFNLALAYQDGGQLGRALPLFEQSYEHRKARLGADDPATLNSMNGLAMAYLDSGEPDQAIPMLREVLKLRQQSERQHGLEVSVYVDVHE